ncbi:hypothetical protein AD998_05505 [bacterium 336/3]|nr:hypothetical protein AD998_05505 [bacterium 336/3]
MKIQLIGKVIASLEPNTLDILIGAEQGLLDGGHIRRVNNQMLPSHLRIPNTKLWIYIENSEIVKTEAFEQK